MSNRKPKKDKARRAIPMTTWAGSPVHVWSDDAERALRLAIGWLSTLAEDSGNLAPPQRRNLKSTLRGLRGMIDEPDDQSSTIRTFLVKMDIDIEVDGRLLDDVLTDEWRKQFYNLKTPEDVASHLACNLIRGRRLNTLDGFADQPEDRARILEAGAEDVTEYETTTGSPGGST